jgi:hypothetical protein
MIINASGPASLASAAAKNQALPTSLAIPANTVDVPIKLFASGYFLLPPGAYYGFLECDIFTETDSAPRFGPCTGLIYQNGPPRIIPFSMSTTIFCDSDTLFVQDISGRSIPGKPFLGGPFPAAGASCSGCPNQMSEVSPPVSTGFGFFNAYGPLSNFNAPIPLGFEATFINSTEGPALPPVTVTLVNFNLEI